jgi:hypothetical protein
MDVALVIGRGHTGCGGVVTLLVEACQVEAEEDDYKQQEHVAAHVGGKSSKVARGVLVSEDLGACADGMLEDEVWRVMMGDFEVMLTDCVTDRPGDEVHGALPRQQTHTETLSGPEREHDVVAEKQTGFRGSAVVGNGHQDDGADITPTHC